MAAEAGVSDKLECVPGVNPVGPPPEMPLYKIREDDGGIDEAVSKE